jgi:hypothetical protein
MTTDPEPEWLYKDPSFFRTYDPVEVVNALESYKDDLLLPVALSDALGKVESLSSRHTIRALIINVRRNTNLKGGDPGRSNWRQKNLSHASGLDDCLRHERIRDRAKKQLMWVSLRQPKLSAY